MKVKPVLDYLAVLIMLPAVLAHEVTHAIAAAPFGKIAEVSLIPPRVLIEYPAGTSVWAVRAANLLPTVVGVAAFIAWYPLLFQLSLPVFAYVAGSWAIYTMPSGKDLRPFKHAEPA